MIPTDKITHTIETMSSYKDLPKKCKLADFEGVVQKLPEDELHDFVLILANIIIGKNADDGNPFNKNLIQI